MADRPTADDYLAQAQAAAGVNRPRPPVTPDLGKIVPFGTSSQARQGPQDPLSWLVDIITRPLSGMTNVVQGTVNDTTDARKKFEAGDVAGALGSAASAAIPPGWKFMEGLLSADPEKHRTFSDVIEESTDRIAPLVDKNYVNERDNVNPVVKGVAGFVGDVGLDPLTWIPGGMLIKAGGLALKGGKMAVQGGSKALTALSDTNRAAKVADDVASEAGAAAAKTVKPTPEGAAASQAERSALDEIAAQASPPDRRPLVQSELDMNFRGTLDDMDEVIRAQSKKTAELDVRVQDHIARSVNAGTQTAKGRTMREGLEALGPMTVRDVRRVPGVTAANAKPAPFRADGDGAGWVNSIADATPAQLAKMPKGIQAAAKLALSGDKRAIQKLEVAYREQYLPMFAAARQSGTILDPFGAVVKPTKAKVIQGEETVLDSLANFKAQLVKDRGVLEAKLGKNLVNALANQGWKPGGFDAAVSRLKGILDQQIDVTTLRRLSATDRAALAHLGIDPANIPTGMKPRSEMNAEPLPKGETAMEQAMRMANDGESTEVVQFAERALDMVIMKDLDRTNLSNTHQYLSHGDTLRTHDQFGAGWGRNHREANNYFQYNIVKSIASSTSSWIKNTFGKALGGPSRAAAASEKIRQSLRLAEKVLDEQGVPLTFGVGAQRIPMGLSQALDVLNQVDRKMTLWAFYNMDTAVPWTNLMDAIYTSVSGGTRESIEAMLRQTTTRNALADGSVKAFDSNMLQGGGRYGKFVMDADMMFAHVAKVIDEARPVFNQVVAENAQALGARGLQETMEISDNVIDNLEQLRQVPGGIGQLLEAITDIGPRTNAISKDFGVLKSSRDTAEALVEAAVPATDKVIAATNINIVKALENIDAAEDVQKVTAKIAQKGYDDLLAEEPFVPGGNVRYIDEQISQVEGRGIAAKVMPIFSRRAGTKRIYPEWMKSENIFRTLVGRYHLRLSNLAKSGLGREEMANRLTNARNGVPSDDPVVNELKDLWGQMFGNGERTGALVDNRFFANGNNIHHVNALFERAGLEHTFDLDDAARVADAEGISVMAAASRQASEWVIDDPLDTMSKLYGAFVSAQTHQTLAQQFVKMAGDLGATSKVPKDGYSLVGTKEGSSIFAKYLPGNVYFQDDVLREMHVVDNMMQQSMDLKGPLGTFIREYYQPLQQAWKYGMTLPNPTHHIRNMVSDYTLTYYVQGVKGARKANTAAFQAMATHDAYDGWSAVRALQGMEELPNAGASVASGKLGDLTADGLYAALANRGNLMTYQHLEQLNAPITKGVLGPEEVEAVGSGLLARSWDKVHQSGAAKKIGSFSEARDHFTRLQHAAQFVIQNVDNVKSAKNPGGYASMEELLDAASDTVRKWHPDGTDMTRTEQYFRLLIPFYSWQRKAIPLIVESLLTHPGRIISIPKAQYNMAVAMGVDPDSLSDPFPQDQLFPNYMTEQIAGPITEIDGNYYGINPGFAGNDILNEWVGSNPLRSILGSTSPLIRAPFELAAGGQVGTGAKINDNSDFVDSQIPGIAQISRMTGNSVTGSLVSMLQGNGLDPQYQIAAGNKDPVAGPALSALNWMTGLGAYNMSQKNQINYAEIEKRNEEGSKNGGF